MPIGESKYRTVVDSVTRAIASGELPEGARLPSVRELAEQHQVSLSTVERAIPVLEDRELIWGQQGRARFVAEGARRRARERMKRDESK